MSKFLETKETNVKSKFSALRMTSFSGGKTTLFNIDSSLN